ncbi:MAG: hypothetical protein DYG98_22140 [Haliscomenobacteraceae bacterium CHB4]|nr:hypothetical protein [Haliscomenobacteraceae bacterium CHB4]
MKNLIFSTALLSCMLTGFSPFAQCPPGALTSPKGNRLFLYFPTASDATFPEYYTLEVVTSPLQPFNVADLDAGIGTTAQLRDRIFQVVQTDYCEFNVQVSQTTTNPSPAGTNWQVVGIGSDAETDSGSDLFGVAQDVDINNTDREDYARVFARSFLNAYGAGTSEPALGGTNSTLERWATAIGHTTSHEAGHNFGLSHSDSAPRSGEDEQNNHVMATGSTGLTGEIRAARNRHFSDRSYEILGHNLGLNIKTLWNWDFVNPNSTDAHSLVLTLLSTASSLTLSWSFNGTMSPWTNPTVASTGGTRTFQGATYNVFTLTFSTDKAWSGGPDGVVPPGVEFHVGASFSEANPIIVYETRLKNSGGTDLPLHPRAVSFDAGTADLASGDFNIRAFNGADAGNLIIRNLQVNFLPRMASIETMMREGRPIDIRGIPVNLRPASKSFRPIENRELKDNFSFTLAKFLDPRHVDETYDSTGCKRGHKGGVNDTKSGEIEYCPHGTVLSLFPSTYVYLTATVVDPDAEYFDRAQNKMVRGPLETRVFYQFAGILPDFNKNGVDDLLDIRNKTSVDENQNGIPDDGEEAPPAKPEPDWLKWLLYLLLILILLYLARRIFKKK